ncbi:unnamed protein product [Effrenium voratum]|nr:unnamed protein product [Effrenium voratum]
MHGADEVFVPPSLAESLAGTYSSGLAGQAGYGLAGSRGGCLPNAQAPDTPHAALAAQATNSAHAAHAHEHTHDGTQCCGNEHDDADHRHYAEVCYSLMSYLDDAESELAMLEDMYSLMIDPHDQALMKLQSDDLLFEMARCAKANDAFLKTLVWSDLDAQEFWLLPPDHQVQERNSSKARTVLRQFVRDWAEEGAEERETQYGCLLDALQRYVPVENQRKPRVLAPGCGLSRLPFECARRGYSAQGNEFSYHMLQGSKWVLNQTFVENSVSIYPFLLNLENRKAARDNLRSVRIPDVCPPKELCPPGVQTTPEDFSMCAGEFIDIYEAQFAEWDAVLTCFFLDTAKNVFLYIRTIADIIRPGGLWANIGPLLYHYAEQPHHISIELSWEEVKPAIQKYFDFKEEDFREAFYTTNSQAMYRTCYKCIYFAAIRNDVETEGESFPVYP